MKHLLSFRVYESQTSSGLTPEQEAFLNRYIRKGGTWSVNPTTGLVDIQGDFFPDNDGLKNFLGIKFGNVTGVFNCSNNQLQSLKGAPQEVNGNFYCENNQLQSLKGAPRKVGGYFNCSHNLLQSLAGAPQEVVGDFDCYSSQLKSLAGAPREVGGHFDCSYNHLQSLEGAPQKIGGHFSCAGNKLQSLEGAPQKVDGDFVCSHNHYQLKSLEGAPKQIDGTFECDEFRLEVGEWNPKGWLEVLRTGYIKAKKLILTLPYLQPDWWNSELQRDPGKTVHFLAPWWKDMPEDMKSKIKIPSGYENELDLFSGFDEMGLF